LFELEVPVRVTREKLLAMTEPGWHTQHRGASLCSYATSFCFVAGNFIGYFCVGINILSDAFHDLLYPRLKVGLG